MALSVPTFAQLDAAADKLQALFDHSGTSDNDIVGANGNYTFTIADLLKNDVNAKASTFFFGDGLDALKQTEYMTAHHITDNHNGTYTAAAGFDFDYSVWTGKGLCGSFSNADVDVKDAPPPVVGHLGASLFSENFDYYGGDTINDPSNGQTVAEVSNLTAIANWTGAEHSELGVSGYGGITASSGAKWLDTQNSPGGINISHAFDDNTKAPAVKLLPGQTEPAHAGASAILSFDIGTQSVDFNGQHYATDPNASFVFKIDGNTVATFHASDFANPNQLQHFDIDIGGAADGYTSGDTHHTLSLVDTSEHAGYAGFAVDSIQIHDWIV